MRRIYNILLNIINMIKAGTMQTLNVGTWQSGFNTSQAKVIRKSGKVVSVYCWIETTSNLTSAWKTCIAGLPDTGADYTTNSASITFEGKTIMIRAVNNTLQARWATNGGSGSFSGYAYITYICK